MISKTKLHQKVRAAATAGLSAALLFGLGIGVASAGEEMTYKGTGIYSATRTLLPLANGGAALSLANTNVATIEPSLTGFMYGECTGLGYLSPKNEMSVEIICTFRENEEDSFDLRGKGTADGIEMTVIGGSGKWADATGSGTFKRRWEKESRGTYDYELKISTP